MKKVLLATCPRFGEVGQNEFVRQFRALVYTNRIGPESTELESVSSSSERESATNWECFQQIPEVGSPLPDMDAQIGGMNLDQVIAEINLVATQPL